MMTQENQPQISTYWEEIKERRYKEDFFCTIFAVFPTLDIVASTFNMSVTQLLQLLLENLYDEGKIDKFVCEMKAFEDNGTAKSIRHALVESIIRQYLNNQTTNHIQNKVSNLVDLIGKMDMVAALLYNPIWEVDIFYIENQLRVKFYDKNHIENKFTEVIMESGTDPLTMKDHLFRDFLFRKFDIPVLYSKKQKKEIEQILTQFYQVHCNRKQ